MPARLYVLRNLRKLFQLRILINVELYSQIIVARDGSTRTCMWHFMRVPNLPERRVEDLSLND